MSQRTAATCCPKPGPIPYEHRLPGTPFKDQSLCFNGKPKSEHICIDECSKPGRLCRNCRLLTDLSDQKETS